MAIFIDGKEVTAVNFGKRAITAVYKGARLVWEAIRSCFGKGFWINTYSWDNADSWKNNS
jgi:hypothetical protein